MNPSASSLERAVACAPSFALNQIPTTGAGAINGNDNHGDIEDGLAEGDLAGQPGVVKQALEGAIEVDVEVAYALDVVSETVRVIGRRLGRNYGTLGPSEIALTLDAKVVRPDGTYVYDWKSRKRVSPARRNLQLRAQCVAVMKADGISTVTGAIGYLDNDDVDAHVFDAFDVPSFFDDMRKMLSRIIAARALVAKGGTPEVHAGPWCEYCPAVAFCPAQTRLALVMIEALVDVNQHVAFMSTEQAGLAWMKLRQIQSLADKVEEALKLRAKQEVVPLPNGKRLALVQSSRRSVDSKKALARLEKAGLETNDLYKTTHFDVVREVNLKPELQAVATDRE